MAEAAFAMKAIGGIVGFASQLMKGDAEKESADFNAIINEQNANITEQNYAENERVFRVNTAQELGSMRASYGASGISSSEGSAAEVIRASAASAELDALKLKQEGKVKAIGYRDQARLDRYSGQQAWNSSRMSAIGGLFGVAGDIVGKSSGGVRPTRVASNRTPAF